MKPWVVLALIALAPPHSVRAQGLDLRGYALNVAVGAGDGAFSSSGVSDAQRIRLMFVPSHGPWTVDVAYEQALTYSSSRAVGGVASGLGTSPAGIHWLPLQGTIAEGDHLQWEHRLDRLAVTVKASDALEVTVGRQPVSWATTLVLTPADAFAPFDPADPFRQYRPGVDAVRVRGFVGPFTEFDAVVRPTDTGSQTTVTALFRGRTVLGRWELGAWGGTVHDDVTTGGAVTTRVGGVALRGEGVWRRSQGEDILRFAMGIDGAFTLWGRDAYVIGEYQHDGFGAGSAEELLEVATSAAAGRGELQTIGKDVVAAQGTYQLHPLASAGALVLMNLHDGSVLASPSVGYSLGNEVSASGGLFFGFGADASAVGLPRSEFGSVPVAAYVAVTGFF